MTDESRTLRFRRCKNSPQYWALDTAIYMGNTIGADLGNLIASNWRPGYSVEIILTEESEVAARASKREQVRAALKSRARARAAEAEEDDRRRAQLEAEEAADKATVAA